MFKRPSSFMTAIKLPKINFRPAKSLNSSPLLAILLFGREGTLIRIDPPIKKPESDTLSGWSRGCSFDKATSSAAANFRHVFDRAPLIPLQAYGATAAARG